MMAVARFQIHWMVSLALGLAVANHFLSRAAQDSVGREFIFAAIGLGALNACLPILARRLTRPHWQLAVALSAVLVNGAALALAAAVVPGFHIPNAGHAIFAVLAMASTSSVFAFWGRSRDGSFPSPPTVDA